MRMVSIWLQGVKGRTELKHEISASDCYLLRIKLKHVMEVDPHGNKDGKYHIRSVYFDNIDNNVLMQKKRFYERDKFRVRLYDLNTDYMNLEKKSKRNNVTYKQKCSITVMSMSVYEPATLLGWEMMAGFYLRICIIKCICFISNQ